MTQWVSGPLKHWNMTYQKDRKYVLNVRKVFHSKSKLGPCEINWCILQQSSQTAYKYSWTFLLFFMDSCVFDPRLLFLGCFCVYGSHQKAIDSNSNTNLTTDDWLAKIYSSSSLPYLCNIAVFAKFVLVWSEISDRNYQNSIWFGSVLFFSPTTHNLFFSFLCISF